MQSVWDEAIQHANKTPAEEQFEVVLKILGTDWTGILCRFGGFDGDRLRNAFRHNARMKERIRLAFTAIRALHIIEGRLDLAAEAMKRGNEILGDDCPVFVIREINQVAISV